MAIDLLKNIAFVNTLFGDFISKKLRYSQGLLEDGDQSAIEADVGIFHPARDAAGEASIDTRCLVDFRQQDEVKP